MHISEAYNSNNKEGKFFFKRRIWSDIEQSLNNKKIRITKGAGSEIKDIITKELCDQGWACNVEIPPSKININYVKRKVGLCLQLGNYARVYADLLKLQLMYDKDLIEIGIIAVPFKNKAKKLGSNHAQFERLVDELRMFEKIINLPLVVIGLDD